MRSILVLFISVFLFLISCESKKKGQTVFQLPIITNSQYHDSIEVAKIQIQYVSEVFPSYVGKYKFDEVVDINPEARDTAFQNDFFYESESRELKDSLSVNGFELFIDYNTSVKYNQYYQFDSVLFEHYPVYFVNSSNAAKVFLGKDGYVFGIQEAMDSSTWQRWRPIEGAGYDFCGNGRWGMIVNPGEFILVLMRKYSGDYKTNLRVRFRLGENIMVSRPFPGTINKSQFFMEDSSYLKEMVQEKYCETADMIFYGASPKLRDE